MTTAFRLTLNTLQSFIDLKIRHYNTVFKPKYLCGAETLISKRKKDIKDTQNNKRQILRKILNPKHWYLDELTILLI